MLSNELPVRFNRVSAAGALPVAVLAQLGDAGARLRHELALRMPLNELPVAVDAVGSLRGAPILLLAAATSGYQQQTDTNRSTSCTDCDHRQHLPLAATGYCNDALTL
jgi:hypothetical protein